MNLRLILLEKIACLKKGCLDDNNRLPIHSLDSWITMGHFDAMHMYKLDASIDGVFRAINKYNLEINEHNSDGFYFHPIYMIDDTEQDDTDFWDHKTWYFAIARIHFASSIAIAKLRECLEEELRVDPLLRNCDYRIYQTIELSDMILALKADNFSDLLKFTLTLQQRYSCIGKVYTYCGINYKYIKNIEMNPKELDSISLFSMRFSVFDFQNVDLILDDIKKILGFSSHYSIVGVDDVVINWDNLPTSKLIDLYRSWFIEGYSSMKTPEIAFLDVTTRIGTFLKPTQIYRCQIKSDNKDLISSCQDLLTLNKQIQTIARNQDNGIAYKTEHRWLNSLSELTKSLMRMSRTAIMDEFVYLMLPGVRSFLINVREQMKRPPYIVKTDVGKYHDFIENWTHLMEHIMRVESQMTHYPEMRPILYDMPVIMLEYTLAFLVKCSNALQTSDTANKKINFLLVPRLCQKIRATELFPATSDRPGLVLVRIPLHMLYDPMSIQIALCHETSHFVGEKHRKREDRILYYTISAAVLLAKIVFFTYNACLIDVIQDELEKTIRFSSEYCTNISEMKDKVLEWTDTLFGIGLNCNDKCNDENYVAFIKKVLRRSAIKNSDTDKSSDRLCIRSNNADLKIMYLTKFQQLLLDVTILFREIYADICMLNLLPICSETYIKSFFTEFAPNESNRYELFAVRIYVSLTASGKNIPIPDGKINNHVIQPLYDEIKKIQCSMKNDLENQEQLIPMGVIRALLSYAKKCYNSLEDSAKYSKSNEIRCTLCDMYTQAVSTQNYSKMQDYINEYREKIVCEKITAD